ncbi:hypothetical protein G7Y79_00040g076390 [Physcia stellaris]|nr:hypothetical protein G7Y79_00040g076390 [Physcia stellaris]
MPPSPLPTLSSTFPINKPTAQTSSSPKTSSVQSTRKSRRAENDAAIRASKLQIRQNIREDWTWPPTDSQPRNTRCTAIETQWRERESDSSLPPSPSLEAQDASSADPYRFEGPDSLLDVKSTRKRKRQHALQEELSYNMGLGTYMQRRDAWTGAMPIPQSPPDSAAEDDSSESVATGAGSDDCDASSLSTSTSNFSTTCHVGKPPSTNDPDFPIPPSTAHDLGAQSPTVLVPLPPPLLPPTNPIRAAISPSTYPNIYSKIIVQGLSPTIPVNLKDIVCAMVDGWKRDGEWPPKDSQGQVYQGKDAATKGDGVGKALAKRGVGRMKRVLGLENQGAARDG